MDTTARRAWGYIRQSQTHDDTLSPALQRSKIERWCAAEGITVVGWSEDIDISGKAEYLSKRVGLEQTVQAVLTGAADLAVAVNTSRFNRDNENAWSLWKKIPMATAEQGYFKTTADGALVFGFNALLDSYYSMKIGEGWSAVHTNRLERGLPPSGGARYGYDVVDGSYVPSGDAQRLVEAYRRYIRGDGFRSIAQWLGGNWQDVTVKQLLDAGFGAGLVKWKGGEYPGAHEAVISPGEWAAYRKERTERGRKGARARNPQWHLSGLVECGICGGPMIRTGGYARCKAYHARGKAACTGAAVGLGVLETQVALWLGGHVEQWAAQMPAVEDVQEVAQRAVADAQAAFDTAEQSVTELVRRAVVLGLEDVEVAPVLADLRAERDAAREALQDAQAALAGASPSDTYDAIVRGGEGMSPEAWNRVHKELIRKVVVSKDKSIQVFSR